MVKNCYNTLLLTSLFYTLGCTSVFDILNNSSNSPTLITENKYLNTNKAIIKLNANIELSNITESDFELSNATITSIVKSNDQYTINLEFVSEGSASIKLSKLDKDKKQTSNLLQIFYDITSPTAPSSLSLGSIPDGTSSVPELIFTDSTDDNSGINRHEVRIYNVDDSTVTKDWYEFKNQTLISGLNLDTYKEYRFEIRSIDNSGNISSVVPSGSWKPNSICKENLLTNSPYASGDGSIATPFLICTAAQLQNISSNTADYNKYFKQMADIDLSNISNFEPIGNATNKFTGLLNGQNYKIKNLNINRPGDNLGLFGFVSYSYLLNLSIHNATINSTTTSASNIAVLTGQSEYSTINNIRIEDSVASGDAPNRIGLMSGTAYRDTIININLSGNSSNVSGNNLVSGGIGDGTYLRFLNITINDLSINGVNDVSALISDCYGCYIQNAIVDANITATGDDVGGIIGTMLQTDILRSSFNGNITGVNYVGGITGKTYDPSLLFLNSTEAVITGQSFVGGIVGAGFYSTDIYDSYSKSTVNNTTTVSNTSTGGIIGGVEYDVHIYNSYSAGNITSSGGSVGGIYGYSDYANSGIDVENNFSVSLIQGSDTANSISNIIGDLITAPSSISLSNNYYYFNCSNTGTGSCNENEGTRENTLSNFYLKTHPVYSTWDFTDIWQENSTALPTLTKKNDDTPSISHSCSTTATESSSYNCSITITDNDKYELQFIVLTENTTCNWAYSTEFNSDTLPYTSSDRIRGTPAASDVGTCTLEFYATDGVNNSEVNTINVTVSPASG